MGGKEGSFTVFSVSLSRFYLTSCRHTVHGVYFLSDPCTHCYSYRLHCGRTLISAVDKSAVISVARSCVLPIITLPCCSAWCSRASGAVLGIHVFVSAVRAGTRPRSRPVTAFVSCFFLFFRARGASMSVPATVASATMALSEETTRFCLALSGSAAATTASLPSVSACPLVPLLC